MVNVFKTLWPKYMLYFPYFNNKIQNAIQAVMQYQYWPVQRNVTMSHEVQSTLLHKTFFGSGYCSVRRKCSVRNIHLAAAGWKNDWLLFRHPDE